MTADRAVGPDPSVLARFGVPGAACRAFSGGAEPSIRAGNLVLKRVRNTSLARWTQELLAAIEPTRCIVPAPRRSSDGRWEVDGWTATDYVDGLSPFACDPTGIIGIGEELSDVLTTAACGDVRPVIDRRDRWAVADRLAWGEADVRLHPDVAALVARLRLCMSPPVPQEACAVIHGDLATNVFVDRSGIPVVLDVSPYHRPKRYGSAIVVVDHLLFLPADVTTADELRRLSGIDRDAIARAFVFRLVSHQLGLGPTDDPALDEILPAIAAAGLM